MATTVDPSGLVDADRIHLAPWEEVTAELEAIATTDGQLLVELSVGTLAYPTHSIEAEQLQEAVSGMEGRTVGILRTEDADSPLAITVE